MDELEAAEGEGAGGEETWQASQGGSDSCRSEALTDDDDEAPGESIGGLASELEAEGGRPNDDASRQRVRAEQRISDRRQGRDGTAARAELAERQVAWSRAERAARRERTTGD
jgi:hypothetical protein